VVVRSNYSFRCREQYPLERDPVIGSRTAARPKIIMVDVMSDCFDRPRQETGDDPGDEKKKPIMVSKSHGV